MGPTPPFLCAVLSPARQNVFAMFDGGMWGLGQAAGDRLRQT